MPGGEKTSVWLVHPGHWFCCSPTESVPVPQCPIEPFDVSKAQGPNNIILSVNEACVGPDSAETAGKPINWGSVV